MTQRDDMIKIWDAQESELARLVKNPADYLKDQGADPEDDPIALFLDNDALEIRREQYLSDDKWVTMQYTIVTGTGGPHVEFSTDYEIRVYWSGEAVESTTQDPDAREAIDLIEEFLKDCYDV